jgi:3-oxoacyl-[acyl-carrier-protein] synthase II
VSAAGRRVAVTGLGVVSGVGNGVPAFFDSLASARSGVRRVPWREDTVAALADFEAEAHFTRIQLGTLDRFAQFALVAAAQAVGQAGLGPGPFGPRSAVYFGSGIGGASSLEQSYRAFLSGGRVAPMTVVLTMPNAAAAHLSLAYGVSGPTLTFAVACASAAVAIGEGFRAIRRGDIDVALVGGSEALVVPGMVAGWNSMRVLAPPCAEAPERSCRPFAADRAGLVLGEGAGVLVLESFDRAAARGAAVLAEMAGYGSTSDASHLAKPSADGQVAAIGAALADAGLPPEAIGYVNAHGTATPVGDPVETEAIKRAFGPHAARLAISSTKALHGHLLGASGAVEFIAALMALRSGTLPPTAHLERPDPQCDLDYVPLEARTGVALEAVMSNSFAFGGSNAVLVARRASAA